MGLALASDTNNPGATNIMAAAAKIFIWAIIISIMVVFLSRVVAIFPFYMTMVTEAFNMANIAAADNYVKEMYWNDAMEGLQSRPMFNDPNTADAYIFVLNETGMSMMNSDISALHASFGGGMTVTGNSSVAIGNNDEFYYVGIDGYIGKPYRQMGNPITIVVAAEFPFAFTLWGEEVGFNVPMSFTLTTTGLRYYKDLPLDNPYDLGDPNEADFDTSDW